MTLPEKIVAVHRSLDAGGIPHAFGGAIALAYHTLNPRGTSDIDVNVFVPATDPGAALAALPPEVPQPHGTAEAIGREGQVRLWWEETPVDVFFDYDPVHARAAQNIRRVEFAGERIPILGPDELALFKAVFDRTQDWADIEALTAAGTVDFPRVCELLVKLVGRGDARVARLDRLVGCD